MKFIVMSDLHLSKKPWQVRKALNMGKGADAVLLAGDLTNDGTPEQLQLMQQCIAECLPDTPVLAVTGNHDCPHQPSPMIRRGICDFPALQDWLLGRQPYPFCLDDSGAWAVRMGDIEVIGLNCVWHWRRFKFQDGAQLDWLQNQLNASDAPWHIILCHAPLLAHNPKRSDTKPYLSRDEKLQSIIDAHRNIIFISGHTHVSMENMFGCVEYDRARNNYYINDGSVRPTTLLDDQGRAVGNPAEGNVVEIDFYDDRPEITGISVETGRPLSGTIWGDGNWDGPVTRAEVIGLLTDHYPKAAETFLQRENYTSSWGGMFFALNVGWDHLGRYGILAEFTLLHPEQRFFRIHRFLTMMDAAKDRYIQAHPDQEQTAQVLYDTLCSNLTEREKQFHEEQKGTNTND